MLLGITPLGSEPLAGNGEAPVAPNQAGWKSLVGPLRLMGANGGGPPPSGARALWLPLMGVA